MEKFMPYVASTSAAIAKYGGEVLDVVEAKEVLERVFCQVDRSAKTNQLGNYAAKLAPVG